MTDILSTFYTNRYSNKPSLFCSTNKHNRTNRDFKLETHGFLTLISSHQRLPPLTADYIKKNKDVNDINNIFLQKSNTITSLSKSFQLPQSNIFYHTNKKSQYQSQYNSKERELILKEAHDKAHDIIISNKNIYNKDHVRRQLYSYNEIKEKSIDCQNYLSSMLINGSFNPSSNKTKKLLSRYTNFSNQLLSSVTDYLKQKQKYHRLKGHFLRPTALVYCQSKNQQKESFKIKEMLSYDIKKPFTYKDSYSFKKRKWNMSQYPVSIHALPSLSKMSFDEKVVSLLNKSHSLKDLVKLQKEEIDKRVLLLKQFNKKKQ